MTRIRALFNPRWPSIVFVVGLWAIVLSVSHLNSQTVYNGSHTTEYEVRLGPVPTSATDIFTSTIRLTKLHLANTDSSAQTCTIIDKGTNCSGGACTIWPTVSMLANQAYDLDMGGLTAMGGARWSCTSTNVHGSIRGVR